MAQLYEIAKEDTHPELTGSLARSFKDGLILPAERKFSLLESEIAAIREHIDTEAQKKRSGWKNAFAAWTRKISS